MNSVAQLKKLLNDSKEELLRSLDHSEKAIISLILKNAEPEDLPVKRGATKSRLRKLTRGGESSAKKPKRDDTPRHELIPKKSKPEQSSEDSASPDEEADELFGTESEEETQPKPATKAKEVKEVKEVKEAKEPEPEEVNYARKPRNAETINALMQELKTAPESRAKVLLDQLNQLISTNFDKTCLNLLASTKLVPTLTALGKERPALRDKVEHMRNNWKGRSATLSGGVENWGRLTTRLADANQSNNYNEVKNCLAKVQTSFPESLTANIAEGFKKCMAEVRKIAELSKNAELKERAKKLYSRYRAKFDQLKF